jgi:glycosyltransferase involved in cell wall biosynthesis
MFMKILLIDNTSLTPANGSLCCEPKTGGFASELQSLGNHVTMYGQIVEDTNNIHAFDIVDNGISVIGYLRKKNKLFNYLFLYFMVIPQILRSDFVYIFYPSAFKYVAFLCWFFRKPYGLYVRGQNDLKSTSSKLLLREADLVFTVADFFSKYIKGINKNNNVYTVKPMINLNETDIIYNKNIQKNKYFKILFLARIEKDKGIEEFLYSISEIKGNFLFNVDIVGEGAWLNKAIDLCKTLEIEDLVTFKGAIFDKDEIKKIYMNAHLYILPTYHEGFPRTLYEAMIFGTPILTTFVGGISGLMVDKFNCLEIKPQSISSIVEGINYAFNNYPEMRKYAKNAIGTVKPIVASSRDSHAQHLNSLINNFDM